MGIKLVVEILDHADPAMDASERLLLVALAERADDATRRVIWRRGEDPRETLTRRTGLSESGLGKVMRRLARRGTPEDQTARRYDPRRTVIEGADGRPVFSFEGTAVEYRIPVFDTPSTPMDNSPSPVDEHPISVEKRPPQRATTEPEAALAGARGRPSGRPLPAERPPARAALVPDVPRESLDAGAREAVAALLARFGDQVSEQVAIDAIAAVIAAKNPDAPARYVSRFSVEDVERWAAGPGNTRARSLRQRGPTSAAPSDRAASPAPRKKCEHGIPGGMGVSGRGEDVSRVCGRCESEHPADVRQEQAS